MKKIKLLLGKIFPNHFKSKDMKSLRLQVFLCNIVKTQTFKKLTLQDQITSLARLIKLAQEDHGYTPKELGRLIKVLNKRLNDDMRDLWGKSYTEYYKNLKR